MLKKVISIKNIGRFKDCRPTGDVEFRKMTLIYAENARGKTTFSDILRSLQSGNPAVIVGRQTLGCTDEPEVNIRLEANNTNFRNGAWTLICPDISLFDTTFVHQNVYAGDCIDHDHKKNLYCVMVGEKGVTLSRKVNELDNAIRNLNKEIGIKKLEAQNYAPKPMTLEQFLKLPKTEEIDKKILDAKQEVKLLEFASEIKAKKPLEKIELPIFPEDFKSMLEKTIEDISVDAEKLIHDHIKLHTNGASEKWLEEGHGYIKNEICPFCAQSVEGNDLISSYQTYFGLSYVQFKQDIYDMQAHINSLFGEKAFLRFQKVIAENKALSTFWKELIELTEPIISFEEQIQTPLESLRNLCQFYLKKKSDLLLEKIDIGPDFASHMVNYRDITKAVNIYNSVIDFTNELIKERKSKAQTGDPKTAQANLQKLKAIKQRYESEAEKACLAYQVSNNKKGILEDQKRDVKSKLDEYTEKILPKYETRINELLKMFSASFRIGGIKRSYIGGIPSSSYHIIINDIPVQLGDNDTPLELPCFRNTLSAGDRTTLALAFFIAQLEQDPLRAKETVVFDDPFTSQDRSRRICTQQLLCKISEYCEQVIVLSHNPSFLKLIWDSLPAAEVKTIQFMRIMQNTSITEWNIEDATIENYFKDHAVISRYLNHGDGDPRKVAQSIRLLLEHYLRVKFPGQFAPNEWLGNFIDKIRVSDASSPLHFAKDALTELEAINQYSKKYHHDTNSGADKEPIDDGELQSYVGRTLDLIHGK
jgi:wobble nucleotide-excising tRNase